MDDIHHRVLIYCTARMVTFQQTIVAPETAIVSIVGVAMVPIVERESKPGQAVLEEMLELLTNGGEPGFKLLHPCSKVDVLPSELVKCFDHVLRADVTTAW